MDSIVKLNNQLLNQLTNQLPDQLIKPISCSVCWQQLAANKPDQLSLEVIQDIQPLTR